VGEVEGYATRYSPADKRPRSAVLAVSRALVETFGLAATFLGIGVIVNVIIVYIVIQVRGEHQQNEEYRAERQQRFGS
jgi:hypothetical protein